jgi:hypothetical protein
MWRITNEQLRANARRAYDEGCLRWFAIAANQAFDPHRFFPIEFESEDFAD